MLSNNGSKIASEIKSSLNWGISLIDSVEMGDLMLFFKVDKCSIENEDIGEVKSIVESVVGSNYELDLTKSTTGQLIRVTVEVM